MQPAEFLNSTTDSPFHGFAWDSKGDHLLAVTANGRIHVWNSTSGELEQTGETSGSGFPDITWTDSLSFVTVSDVGRVVSWNTSLDDTREVVRVPMRWIVARVSPCGQWLAICPTFSDMMMVDTSEPAHRRSDSQYRRT